jgi:excisionase family DNA binding protein
MTNTEYLTVAEAAAMLDIHPQTLHNWTQEGKVPVVQPHPNARRRYRREDIEALLAPKIKTGA